MVAQTGTSEWAKAGLMLAQGRDPDAAHYAVLITPGHGLIVQYRARRGGDSIRIASLPEATAPLYLRVARAGTRCTAYTSQDGASWSELPNAAVDLTWDGPLLEGLAVTSHDTDHLSSAVFDSVRLR